MSSPRIPVVTVAAAPVAVTAAPADAALVDKIEALLPQTQCGKCKTPGCRPYAEDIAKGAPINHCVPGGADTIADLAALLGQPVLPLAPDYGVEPETRRVAFIREAECIGCTKCLQACPVDAIVGAAKLMHTVITDECTGCDLCIPPCPVDCIDIHDLPKVTDKAERLAVAAHHKKRFDAHTARLERLKKEAEKPLPPAPDVPAPAAATPASDKSRVIAAALARSNLKKAEKKLQGAQESGDDTSALLVEIAHLKAELQKLSQGG